ncbi:MAG: nucleotide exchange factor GrpE [Parvibaculum sp.]
MSDQDGSKENPTDMSDDKSTAGLEAAADDLLAKAAAAAGGAGDGVAEDTRSEEEKIADAMAALVAENGELKDRVLRGAAELENLRRRAEREKADAAKFGATRFAQAVLSVADNLRRAIDAVPADRKDGSDDVVQSIVDGIEMVERSLLTAFEQNGIVPVSPAPGEKFNANLHEALFEVPGTGQPGGSIVQVVDVGYMIGDRLLRAARVGVAKAGEDGPPGAKVDTTA